jgi:uncharacterized protein YcbK (DUF882 family)
MRVIAVALVALGIGVATTTSLAQKPAVRTTRPSPLPYSAFVHAWHTPAEGRTAPVDAAGRAMLVLSAINTSERADIPALTDDGAFAAHDLDRAAHLLRDPHTGNEYPVEPRVLGALYRIQRKFGAQEIRVISGYRTPRGTGGSNHGKGRAIDIVVPGTSDEDVAKFARDMGFMGVGVYPVSGFVHVDVRDRSYYWIDSSGPGRRNRERGVLGDVAQRADAAALARGERGLNPILVGGDVDAVLRTQTTAPTTPPDEDDDDWSP